MGGAARAACDHCGGKLLSGIHDDECPSSRVSQRRLRQEVAALGQGRLVWSFGVQSVATPEGNKLVFNPNIPYVNAANGKPWTAGGVPADADERMDAFREAMQLAALTGDRWR